MQLTGDWVAIAADDELRRRFADPELDLADWESIAPASHWRSNPAFADTDGPLFYRTRFEVPDADGAGRRHWLRFDGIFYEGDVWLDGAYLGDTEGYFAPHTFEITDAVAARAEHVLAVEVACSQPSDRTAKRNITGVFQHWDCFDPDWNPGGIWRPVEVHTTGPARIASLRTLCVEATTARAVVRFQATIDAAEAVAATIRTTVAGVEVTEPQALAEGDNALEWTVTIDRPPLWWPRALHDPTLVDCAVEVHVGDDPDAAPSDERRFRTGLRTIELHDWVASVNGERLFLKGANQGPTKMAIAEATEADCRRDIDLAVEAGLDFLRLHAHIARPETYEAADEAGLLLWQDFPLQWGYARQIRKQAVRQAQQAVDQLGHHPSVAIWCAHNEPMGLDIDPAAFTDPKRTAQLGVRAMAQQQLPTWNKTVLDRSLKRAFTKADGTRPVIPHSGVLPHLPRLDGTDSHLYFGWYWGDERDFPAFCAAMPRMARFVTEFGAQAVPDTDGFVDPDAWPQLDWDRLAERHSLQWSVLDKYVPTADYDSYEAWRAGTQQYQATVLRHHIETLRRLKYRPTGGFAMFSFADGHPAITWSVLDHQRVPKLGYHAVQAACRPVIVVSDRLPRWVRPGEHLSIDVHVVSDRRHDLTGELQATFSWAGGSESFHFGGTVPEDSCVKVTTLDFVVPEATGLLRLSLSGIVGDEPVSNGDETFVA